jgi:hypothetical protein
MTKEVLYTMHPGFQGDILKTNQERSLREMDPGISMRIYLSNARLKI